MARSWWVLAALAWPQASLADDVSVVVIPIIVGDAPDVRGVDLHEAVVAAARQRASMRVMSTEEAFVAGAKLEELETCGVDPMCLGRELAASRASMAVIVLANVLDATPLVAVRLFDVRSRKFIATSAAPLAREERDIARAVAGRAALLFDQAGFPLHARVRVEITPSDASVSVLGGAPEPGNPGVYLVPAGPCAVRAERAGYLTAEVEVAAKAGASVSVSFVLEPEPEPTVLSSPWFWGVTIGAVVLTGVLVYVGIEASRCLCVAGRPCDC